MNATEQAWETLFVPNDCALPHGWVSRECICPVCGDASGYLEYDPSDDDIPHIARAGDHRPYITCERHSLADLHRAQHPGRIPERRRR